MAFDAFISCLTHYLFIVLCSAACQRDMLEAKDTSENMKKGGNQIKEIEEIRLVTGWHASKKGLIILEVHS